MIITKKQATALLELFEETGTDAADVWNQHARSTDLDVAFPTGLGFMFAVISQSGAVEQSFWMRLKRMLARAARSRNRCPWRGRTASASTKEGPRIITKKQVTAVLELFEETGTDGAHVWNSHPRSIELNAAFPTGRGCMFAVIRRSGAVGQSFWTR